MASPDKPEADEWKARVLHAFAHPNRLKILLMLHQGKQSGGMLARELGVSETTVLKHLVVLRTSNIIVMRREGKAVFYEMAAPEWGAFLTLALDIPMRSDSGR